MTYRTMREPVRPIPDGYIPPARFYWPSEAHLTPKQCGNCGARLIRGDIPTADAPLTDVTCLLCTQVACELQHDSLRQAMTPAERFHALPVVHLKRGPKPKGRSCCDCSAPTARYDAERCKPCANRYRRQ